MLQPLRELLAEGSVGIKMMDPARIVDGIRAGWQKGSALMPDSTSRVFSVSIGDLWEEHWSRAQNESCADGGKIEFIFIKRTEHTIIAAD